MAFDLAWPVQFAAFTLLGFGFYTLHASIQVQATELSTDARGAAMSLHSFFFFVGHASGPVLYGLGFSQLGAAVTIAVAGVDRPGGRVRLRAAAAGAGQLADV